MNEALNSASKKDTLKTINVYCGEICQKTDCSANEINLIYDQESEIQQNIVVGLTRFVINPHSLSNERINDLLEIAAYIHCADRQADRGDRHSLNNDGWARSFLFHIPVRDYIFWNRDQVKYALNEALSFMTGDRKYSFEFVKMKKDVLEKGKAQQSMFSNEYLFIEDANNTDVMLFSGGLDSLAGAIKRLELFPNRKLCLVSHKSNKVVSHNLNSVVDYLKENYSNRIIHYTFECHCTKYAKSKEETQRTRMFLFSAIAFAICTCYEKKELYIYENGVTSLNLHKQEDVFNARASRTTHPKTIGLLQNFYDLLGENVRIIVPFYNMTKAEVIRIFSEYHKEKIIPSSVSCSSSRNMPVASPHCGICSQCIDRIFAMYASEMNDYDAAYSSDIIHNIPDMETNQRVYDTLHFAIRQNIQSPTDLFEEYGSEMNDILPFWPNSNNPENALTEVFDLIKRYGESILKAAQRIRYLHEDLRRKPNSRSMLSILNDKTYMETPYALRVNEIDKILNKVIPIAFQREKPMNENDLNDKIQAFLCSDKNNYTREYPVIKFGLTSYRADHGDGSLIIESKYIRGKASPSVAMSGIAVDIVQIPEQYGIMFVVYDPDRRITDDDVYIQTLEEKRNNCFVKIYR